jgi:hypothetical protein
MLPCFMILLLVVAVAARISSTYLFCRCVAVRSKMVD